MLSLMDTQDEMHKFAARAMTADAAPLLLAIDVTDGQVCTGWSVSGAHDCSAQTLFPCRPHRDFRLVAVLRILTFDINPGRNRNTDLARAGSWQ